jgi:creatinine amidohydrolase/Fe(II)-dependent formamide hydrolase-like protein
VIGDPRDATAALGAELFASAVRKLGEAMKEIVDFEFPITAE